MIEIKTAVIAIVLDVLVEVIRRLFCGSLSREVIYHGKASEDDSK